MKVMLSPVGNQDPHGKRGLDSGDATEGSAVAIFKTVRPDVLILLPTKPASGRDTFGAANDTKDWVEGLVPGSDVRIEPVVMDAASDYEEALRSYGAALVNCASKFPGAEIVVNASSGTPAIKLACLMMIAEGQINATPYYADDPTESRRPDRVRPVNVTFLRERAMMARASDLLRHGQFGLAAEPLSELAGIAGSSQPADPAGSTQPLPAAYQPSRREWAGFWLRVAQILNQWCERDYRNAEARLAKLLREWTSCPLAVHQELKRQQTCLAGLSAQTAPDGLIPWDIFCEADRHKEQSHRMAAVDHYWIAIESVVYERAMRRHGRSDSDPSFQLSDAVRFLANNDSDARAVWSMSVHAVPMHQHFWNLRAVRNAIVHRGQPATTGNVAAARDLAAQWITALGCAPHGEFPMSPDALHRLAKLFLTEELHK